MTEKPSELANVSAAGRVIHSIKGFGKDLKNRGFQYELGKTYTHDGPVKANESGFHAMGGCPLELFRDYPPATSRYADTTQSGAMSYHVKKYGNIASEIITIGAEVHLDELIQRAVKWDLDHAKLAPGAHATGEGGAASATGWKGAARATGWGGTASATGWKGAASATGKYGAAVVVSWNGAASATGEYGTASTPGWGGAASATGAYGAARATGWGGAASATGKGGAASATGWKGEASATGEHGAAMSIGFGGRVMGVAGCALFLVYRDPNTGEILHAWAGIIGTTEGIKPMTWYQLNAEGKPMEDPNA